MFQVADQVYGLNLNSLQAVLLQPDALQARTPALMLNPKPNPGFMPSYLCMLIG